MRRAAALGALALPVALAIAGSKPAPADSAVRPCDRVKVFRYDVTVTGSKSGRETFPPGSRFAGEFSLSYDYTVRYPRVRVRVNLGCDPFIDTVRARGGGTGALANYSWADRSTRTDPADGTKVPCEFLLNVGSLPASLRLAGGTTVLGGGPATLQVFSALRRSRQLSLLDQIQASRLSACDKGVFPNFNASDELALHRSVPVWENPSRAGGVKVEPPSVFLDGSLVGGGRRNPRLLARLVAGRSARVSTGMRSYSGTDDESSATASASVTIRFARRR